MSRIKKDTSLESLFPNPQARESADAVVDALPEDTTTIAQMIQAWESEYFRVAGHSPVRGK